MYHIFITHSSNDGHPGCIHFLAVLRGEAMNMDGYLLSSLQ